MGAIILEGPTLPGGRQLVIETFTCSHCNKPCRKYTPEGKRLDLIRCSGCTDEKKPGVTGLICIACARKGTCMTFEQKLDTFDRIVKRTGRALDLEKLEEHALIIG